jgi:hypothetical protein
MLRTLAALALLFTLSVLCSAQWFNYPERGAPRNADGTVNLTAPAPKQADGKPDLSGVWLGDNWSPAGRRPALPGGRGVPNSKMLPGFWAKLLILEGLAREGSTMHLVALGAVLLGSVIKANYLFRFAAKLYSRSDHPQPRFGFMDIGATALIGIVLIVVTAYIAPIGDRLRVVAEQAANRNTYISTVYASRTSPAAPEAHK